MSDGLVAVCFSSGRIVGKNVRTGATAVVKTGTPLEKVAVTDVSEFTTAEELSKPSTETIAPQSAEGNDTPVMSTIVALVSVAAYMVGDDALSYSYLHNASSSKFSQEKLPENVLSFSVSL